MASPVKPEPTPDGVQDGEGAVPQRSPIEEALLAARGRIDGGGSMNDVPADPPPDDPPADPPPDEGDDTGVPEATPPDDPPAGEGDDEGDDEGGDEGAAEGAAEGEPAEGAAADADDNLVVAIPARRDGDEDVEIVVTDPDVAERLRQLTNSAMRGEEVKASLARVERDQEQIEAMQAHITTDPVGFIVANVPDEVQEMVAMSLVTIPAIWEKVQERIENLSDPATLRLTQAELKTERLEATNKLGDIAKERREIRAQAKLVTEGIDKMIPVTDGISDSRRATIITSVQEAVRTAVVEKRLQSIDVKDLPLLASAALRSHGIDPIAAAGALQGDSVDLTPGAKPPAKKKQRTAAELKSASELKAAAAAGTPPGSGAPTASPKLPAGQSVEDRIALARKHGIGALLTGK